MWPLATLPLSALSHGVNGFLTLGINTQPGTPLDLTYLWKLPQCRREGGPSLPLGFSQAQTCGTDFPQPKAGWTGDTVGPLRTFSRSGRILLEGLVSVSLQGW